MSSSDEIITLVDRQNQVIGDVLRSQMDFGKDIHRVTFILVFTGNDRLLVQKRSDTKAFCPGFYGITTGGVVATGESYMECAERELEEEIGVSLPLTTHGMFFTEGEGFRIWGKVYSCQYDAQRDGPLTLQTKEVAEVLELPIDDILSNPSQRPFTPDSYDALLHYVHNDLQTSADDPI